LVKSLYWGDIFEKPRVVILAEAGAGKTYELEKPLGFRKVCRLNEHLERNVSGTGP
jgi:hypothetical protein